MDYSYAVGWRSFNHHQPSIASLVDPGSDVLTLFPPVSASRIIPQNINITATLLFCDERARRLSILLVPCFLVIDACVKLYLGTEINWKQNRIRALQIRRGAEIAACSNYSAAGLTDHASTAVVPLRRINCTVQHTVGQYVPVAKLKSNCLYTCLQKLFFCSLRSQTYLSIIGKVVS